jgi:hypothetical protein
MHLRGAPRLGSCTPRTHMATSDVLRKPARVDDERTLRHESTCADDARAEALARLARERLVTDLERLAKREQPHDGSWNELSRETEIPFLWQR